jgi:hypothetical protein
VGRQSTIHTENSGFASPALGSAHFHVSWLSDFIFYQKLHTKQLFFFFYSFLISSKILKNITKFIPKQINCGISSTPLIRINEPQYMSALVIIANVNLPLIMHAVSPRFLSFNGIYKVAVAVQRQRVIYTENSGFASPALGSAHFHVF